MRAITSIRRLPGALILLGASMRVRLTLWYLAILALVFLVFSGILIAEVRANEESAQRADLASVAQQLARAYNPTDGLISADVLQPKLGVSMKTQQAVTTPLIIPARGVALLVDAQGGIIQTIGPLTTDGVARLRQFALTGVSSGVSSSGSASAVARSSVAYGAVSLPVTSSQIDPKQVEYLAYSTDVVSQGRLVGTLVVATPNALDQTARSVIPALLIAGPVTLLVAALGGYWLASRALRPVHLITRAAREISETDLSRRLRLNRRDELGELAATFDHMLGRLDAAFQRQRQFTSDASHELRTPLTIVNLEVTNALAAPRAPQAYVRALTAIQTENSYMSRLVGDLLTLARADADRAPLRLAPLDLSDVALEAVERLTPLAQGRDIRLVVGDLPDVSVTGDRATLTQALTNLVENGIKYTAGSGSRVTVTTCYASIDGRAWAVARVEDDGPGIAPEHLPFLFDRFYRVDTARAAEASSQQDAARELDDAIGGSGLGLAIAQWAAQAHGGEVRVESAVGAGAVFEVRLPVSSERSDSAEASVSYCE